MSIQVIWTKRVTDFFEEMANLNETERKILESRIAGMTVRQMSRYYAMSERTIATIIARLKVKYDEVQKEFPDDLKPRRNSAAETYMDNN